MSTPGTAFPCSLCGVLIFRQIGHTCVGFSNLPPHQTTATGSGFAWNGPVCHVCGQGYLNVHECDLERIPCPDGRPGCTVAHYRHKR